MKFMDVFTRIISVAAALLGLAATVLVFTLHGGPATRGPRGYNGTSTVARNGTSIAVGPKFGIGDIVGILGGRKAFGVGCRQNFSGDKFMITDIYKGDKIIYGLRNDDWKFYEKESSLE